MTQKTWLLYKKSLTDRDIPGPTVIWMLYEVTYYTLMRYDPQHSEFLLEG